MVAADVALVVFDWAGTLVDHGCLAPVRAFHEAFADVGLAVSDEVVRQPMGLHKRDHVRQVLQSPAVAAQLGGPRDDAPDDTLVDTVYQIFCRGLPSALRRHAEPIPGAIATLAWLRVRGVHVGTTTGYTRAMMDQLAPAAQAAGLWPDHLVCADEVPDGRPAPWACFRIAERTGVYPLSRAVKVGDTPADMAEGRHAGMLCVGVSDTGNEVGLSAAAWAALADGDREQRRAEARRRLLGAGAHVVLRSVADLPFWLESRRG